MKTETYKPSSISYVRSMFWTDHPELWPHFRKGKRQNDYPADVRMTFIDYVDGLQKSGVITDKLASRVTL